MRALAQIAREINLGTYLKIGKGEEATNGREKNSILADTFEALVGAIYLQHGYIKSAEVISKWINPAIVTATSQGSTLDSKTALQELSALMNLASPEYEITESGPDHDKSFMACVLLSDEKFPAGKGKSKRKLNKQLQRLHMKYWSIEIKSK